MALVGGVLNYGIVSRELIHLFFFGSKIPSQVRHKKIDSLHTYCPTRCPFCGSEMQENDMFCWSLKCDMSPAFTPDGMWGEDSNELKSDTQMSSLLALDEQVISPPKGYGNSKNEKNKGYLLGLVTCYFSTLDFEMDIVCGHYLVQARIKWIGETSLGYGANMSESTPIN